MLEELQTYTDPTKIHELDEVTAQKMYDDAILAIQSSINPEILSDEEIEDNLGEASEILAAAEDFAYAYYKQNGQKLEGAPDVPTSFEHTLTPSGEKIVPLTVAELDLLIVNYTALRFPANFQPNVPYRR